MGVFSNYSSLHICFCTPYIRLMIVRCHTNCDCTSLNTYQILSMACETKFVFNPFSSLPKTIKIWNTTNALTGPFSDTISAFSFMRVRWGFMSCTLLETIEFQASNRLLALLRPRCKFKTMRAGNVPCIGYSWNFTGFLVVHVQTGGGKRLVVGEIPLPVV